MRRRLLVMLAASAIALSLPSAGLAEDGELNIPIPDVSGLGVGDGAWTPDLSPDLAGATGPVKVVVRMVDAPLAVAVGRDAKQNGSALKPAGQKAYVAALGKKQAALLGQVNALGGTTLGQVSKALNAVIVEVDAGRLAAIAALPNVHSIRPLVDYQVDLSETVPYIGAATAQAADVDGTGVRVAVLDSGIDYTHFNLGGSGDVTVFNANDPTVIEAGSFPTAKVVGGYDFVGEVWPNGNLAPDADPLDKGTGAGHGTHVADIIGGKSMSGMHKGVAPGASLYAVGVCSKVSTSCSGVALLQGMDYALDPNGDDSISDAVDVVNMSLGSAYGQRQDDLSAASANAVRMGVVVVASAGNNADKPYVVGSPSSTPEVISVAQTQVPSAKLYRIVAGAVTAGGSWQPWSAAPVYVSGPLVYDTTSAATRIGCSNAAGANPWVGTPFSGKVLLVDRGTCAISFKVSNGAAAGALAVVIANNAAQAPGDPPPDFSFGGGTPTVAGYSITQADGASLKTVLGQTATIDPATAASLAMSVVSSSSRGPSYSYNAIKPDIGAPGGSVSAQYGTGTGQTAFSGTSGAAPMVAGSAALVIDKYDDIAPPQVKARLMNTGETNIGINPVGLPGVLAPITRIGGGEVRVDKAIATKTAAWDAAALTGSLSFGYQALTGSTAFQKSVVVHNYGTTARTYTITPTFRYADDAASGAVTISAPATIRVAANSSATFNVKLKVDVTKLPVWNLNGGARGGDGYRLQGFEFDGYVNIADATDSVHVAWQILPHRSAAVTPASTSVTLTGGTGTLALSNATGAVDGRVDVFSLLGASGRIPPPLQPADGDNYALIDLKTFGARLVDIGGGVYGIQFAVDTFGTRAHPNYPAEFDVYLDTNRDGTDDFVIYNLELNGFGASGQNVVRVYNLHSAASFTRFYADADLDSGNVILTALLSDLGITQATQFDVSVYAFDNYFTGNLTDQITGMTYTAGTPRYAPDTYTPVVAAGGSVSLGISAVPSGATASPSQKGLLLMYRDARTQREADAIYVTP
ncbi:MAG: S8 family serine peptidase [Chloroflexi bacterium]|nr:S8 family serine peptidase [Chloroflexota bacterium]